jgi:hypothetical protein
MKDFIFDIDIFNPHSMCLQYMHSYSEWKEKKEIILKNSQHESFLNESQFLKIYNFSF